jgi:hypothetical protein
MSLLPPCHARLHSTYPHRLPALCSPPHYVAPPQIPLASTSWHATSVGLKIFRSSPLSSGNPVDLDSALSSSSNMRLKSSGTVKMLHAPNFTRRHGSCRPQCGLLTHRVGLGSIQDTRNITCGGFGEVVAKGSVEHEGVTWTITELSVGIELQRQQIKHFVL